MNQRTFALALLITTCAAACDHQPPAPPAATPAPAPPPEIARLPLAERLAREAAARPPIPLPSERVQQALVKEGITLPRWKQVLASPVGARFCMAGLTAAGLALSVCEYPDAAGATRGLVTSHARFDRLIPDRTLVRNGATLLTVTHPSAAARAQGERLGRIFAAL